MEGADYVIKFNQYQFDCIFLIIFSQLARVATGFGLLWLHAQRAIETNDFAV